MYGINYALLLDDGDGQEMVSFSCCNVVMHVLVCVWCVCLCVCVCVCVCLAAPSKMSQTHLNEKHTSKAAKDHIL